MNNALTYTRSVRLLWALEASIKNLRGKIQAAPELQRFQMENRVAALNIEAENTRYYINALRPGAPR